METGMEEEVKLPISEIFDEEEVGFSSDSEIGDALDYLDSKDDSEAVDGAFSLYARRPNAHGGVHSRPNASPLQPLSNRNQKFTHHIRASPLEEWEGRRDVVMSNSVTTAIRGSVRDMAIGKTKTTEKADRATVEQGLLLRLDAFWRSFSEVRCRFMFWKIFDDLRRLYFGKCIILIPKSRIEARISHGFSSPNCPPYQTALLTKLPSSPNCSPHQTALLTKLLSSPNCPPHQTALLTKLPTVGMKNVDVDMENVDVDMDLIPDDDLESSFYTLAKILLFLRPSWTLAGMNPIRISG